MDDFGMYQINYEMQACLVLTTVRPGCSQRTNVHHCGRHHMGYKPMALVSILQLHRREMLFS